MYFAWTSSSTQPSHTYYYFRSYIVSLPDMELLWYFRIVNYATFLKAKVMSYGGGIVESGICLGIYGCEKINLNLKNSVKNCSLMEYDWHYSMCKLLIFYCCNSPRDIRHFMIVQSQVLDIYFCLTSKFLKLVTHIFINPCLDALLISLHRETEVDHQNIRQ